MSTIQPLKKRRVSFLSRSPVHTQSLLDIQRSIEYAWAKSTIGRAQASTHKSILLSKRRVYTQLASDDRFTSEARVGLSLSALRLGPDYMPIIDDADKIRFSRDALIQFMVGLGGESSRLGIRWLEAQQRRWRTERRLQSYVFHILNSNNSGMIASAVGALTDIYDEHTNNKNNNVQYQTVKCNIDRLGMYYIYLLIKTIKFEFL